MRGCEEARDANEKDRIDKGPKERSDRNPGEFVGMEEVRKSM